METRLPALGRMSEVTFNSNLIAHELIASPGENHSNIYIDLHAEDMVSPLVAGSDSFTASHEEQPSRTDEVQIAIAVNGGAIQGYDPSTNYFEKYPESVILSGVGDVQTNNQLLQPSLATNLTAAPITTNVVAHTRGRNKSGPYTCPHCGAQNPTPSRHRQHIVRHQSANLSCPTCGKAIKRKGDLVRHIQTHQKMWVCNGDMEGCGDGGCGRSFTRRDGLLRHGALMMKAGAESVVKA